MDIYDNMLWSLKYKTRGKIAYEVPALAIRGQVTSRHPFKMNIGQDAGIKNRDKIVIYRSKEKKGEQYSSRVCTTRACNVKNDAANLYTFAGGHASYKKGDVAVYQPHKNSSWTISANYMDHSYGANFTYDHRLKLSKVGISRYFITTIGVGGYENARKRYYATNTGAVTYSPIIIDLGVGYGIGYEFAHCLEISPYFQAQWEALCFIPKKTSPYNNIDGKKYAEGAMSNAIRFPLGAKLNINLSYPVQLTIGAEYIFNVKFHVEADNGERVKGDPEAFFFKPTGYKRDGLNLYAGLRFNF